MKSRYKNAANEILLSINLDVMMRRTGVFDRLYTEPEVRF